MPEWSVLPDYLPWTDNPLHFPATRFHILPMRNVKPKACQGSSGKSFFNPGQKIDKFAQSGIMPDQHRRTEQIINVFDNVDQTTCSGKIQTLFKNDFSFIQPRSLERQPGGLAGSLGR